MISNQKQHQIGRGKNNLSSGQMKGTAKVLISPGEGTEDLVNGQGSGGEEGRKLEGRGRSVYCLATTGEIWGGCGRRGARVGRAK